MSIRCHVRVLPFSGVQMTMRGRRGPRVLTDDQAREIYHKRTVEGVKIKTLAAEYGVSTATIGIYVKKVEEFKLFVTNDKMVCNAKKMYDMYLSGYSYEALGRIWKVSTRMARRIVSEWYPAIKKGGITI